MINICDFISSLCFLLSAFDFHFCYSEIFNIILGYFIQFFYLSSFCWTACYAIYLVELVVKQYEKPTRHWTNQLVAWVLPILSIVGMGIVQFSGVSIIGDCGRVWPWINNNILHAFVYQMSFLYIPIVAIILFNIILYMQISCKSKGEEMHCSILLRCLAYILTALFCISWSCTDRILHFFLKRVISYPFDIISLSIPLLGFLNVCSYSLNKFFFTSFKRQPKNPLLDDHGDLMEETIPVTVPLTIN